MLREIRLDTVTNTAGPLETLLMLDENESGFCLATSADKGGVVVAEASWNHVCSGSGLLPTGRMPVVEERERLWGLASRTTGVLAKRLHRPTCGRLILARWSLLSWSWLGADASSWARIRCAVVLGMSRRARFWGGSSRAAVVLTLTACRSSPNLCLESQSNGRLVSIGEDHVTAGRMFIVLLAHLHHGIDSANGQDLPFVADEGLRL